MNKDQLELSYQLAEAREEYSNIKGGIETLKNTLEELERQMEEGQLHKHAVRIVVVSCPYFPFIRLEWV